MSLKLINSVIIGYAIIVTGAAVIFFNSDRKSRSDAGDRGNERVRHGQLPAPVLKPDSQKELAIFSLYLSQNVAKTHGPLFAMLSRTMDRVKLNELQSLLAQRDLAVAELRRGHPRAPEVLRPLIAGIKNRTRNEIEKKYGEKTTGIIDQYENSMLERQVVDDVNSTLIYENNEMTSENMDRMISLLKDNATPPPRMDASADDFDEYVRSKSIAQSKILGIAMAYLKPIQLSAFRKEFDLESSYLNYIRMRRLNSLAGQL